MKEKNKFYIDGGDEYLSGTVYTDLSYEDLKETVFEGVKIKELKKKKLKWMK